MLPMCGKFCAVGALPGEVSKPWDHTDSRSLTICHIWGNGCFRLWICGFASGHDAVVARGVTRVAETGFVTGVSAVTPAEIRG